MAATLTLDASSSGVGQTETPPIFFGLTEHELSKLIRAVAQKLNAKLAGTFLDAQTDWQVYKRGRVRTRRTADLEQTAWMFVLMNRANIEAHLLTCKPEAAKSYLWSVIANSMRDGMLRRDVPRSPDNPCVVGLKHLYEKLKHEESAPIDGSEHDDKDVWYPDGVRQGADNSEFAKPAQQLKPIRLIRTPQQNWNGNHDVREQELFQHRREMLQAANVSYAHRVLRDFTEWKFEERPWGNLPYEVQSALEEQHNASQNAAHLCEPFADIDSNTWLQPELLNSNRLYAITPPELRHIALLCFAHDMLQADVARLLKKQPKIISRQYGELMGVWRTYLTGTHEQRRAMKTYPVRGEHLYDWQRHLRGAASVEDCRDWTRHLPWMSDADRLALEERHRRHHLDFDRAFIVPVVTDIISPDVVFTNCLEHGKPNGFRIVEFRNPIEESESHSQTVDAYWTPKIDGFSIEGWHMLRTYDSPKKYMAEYARKIVYRGRHVTSDGFLIDTIGISTRNPVMTYFRAWHPQTVPVLDYRWSPHQEFVLRSTWMWHNWRQGSDPSNHLMAGRLELLHGKREFEFAGAPYCPIVIDWSERQGLPEFSPVVIDLKTGKDTTTKKGDPANSIVVWRQWVAVRRLLAVHSVTL